MMVRAVENLRSRIEATGVIGIDDEFTEETPAQVNCLELQAQLTVLTEHITKGRYDNHSDKKRIARKN